MRFCTGLKIAILLAGAAILTPSARAQTQLAGDWQGTLSAGGVQLRLVLHIAAASGGALTATLDSVDQDALGIPVSAIAVKGAAFTMSVDAVHGSYEGTVNKNATEIDGTWTQGQPLPLQFKRAAPETVPSVPPSDVEGTWMGTLELGAAHLRVVFKLANTVAGLSAQLQSPDQSPVWISASSIKRQGDSLTIEISKIDAVFEGKIAADRNSIDGVFAQMGNKTPLVLKRVKKESEIERPRPQNPVKPYPYREEHVSYTTAADDTLAATMTVPPGKGPFPAVLLIAGSGPHDRDESLMGHKPFLVLADFLTRRGILVLRADKRGIGKSTGTYITATTADFADDAQAGVEFLKMRPEADPHRVGLIGHSEGGIIAPMVAVRDRDVAFLVLMAAPGVPGAEIVEAQQRLILQTSGVAREKIEQNAAMQRQIVALVEKYPDKEALDKQLRALLAGQSEAQIGAQIAMADTPWFRYFLTYDPATALRQLKCPVLVLNGEKDMQVPPALNLPPIRKALEEAGNTHFEIDKLPGLNHLFQPAQTGLPTEYAQIDTTIAPVVLDKIADWILKQ